jgi:hypothetical protein
MTKFVAEANRRVSASEPLRRYRATFKVVNPESTLLVSDCGFTTLNPARGESPQPPLVRGAKSAFVGCVLRTETVKIAANFVGDTTCNGARCTKFVYVSLSEALRMRPSPYTFTFLSTRGEDHE